MDEIKKFKVNDNFLKELYVRGYYHVSKDFYPINYERVG